MIPRYQRILFAVLMGLSVLMAVFLLHLRERSHERMMAVRSAAPIAAPATTEAENITFAMASDVDGTITPSDRQIALPQEKEARTRALMERLLAEYALPKSLHPLPAGPEVDDVFLLPVSAETSTTDSAEEDASRAPLLAVISLHGAFADNHPSGIQVEALTIQSILGTLHANLPQIEQVRFLVDGQPRDTLAGHADLTRIYNVGDATTILTNTSQVRP